MADLREDALMAPADTDKLDAKATATALRVSKALLQFNECRSFLAAVPSSPEKFCREFLRSSRKNQLAVRGFS